MTEGPRIAVLYGGDSQEAAVSHASAKEVIRALRDRFQRVTPIDLADDFTTALRAGHDVVFPVLHGPPGEDGTVQGLLEMMGLPYVGSGVEASAVGMNKVLAKHVFRAIDLPLADQFVVTDALPSHEVAEQVVRALGERVVVKPMAQGSALGVTLVHNANQLPAAIDAARALGNRVLVEKMIDGREMTVAVLDECDGEPVALPVVDILTPEDTWYDYEHRYTQGKSTHIVPAELPETTRAQLQAIALAAHQALGCCDLSRADFVLSEQSGPVLLEVNTLPGMTATSLYPDAARAAGITFESLLARLIDSAVRRGPRR